MHLSGGKWEEFQLTCWELYLENYLIYTTAWLSECVHIFYILYKVNT